MKIKVMLCVLMLAGCAAEHRAPVVDQLDVPPKKTSSKRVVAEKDWRPQVYTVQKGDTLYAIAFNHGMDYREIVELNGIQDPNVIQVGQQLRLMVAADAKSAEKIAETAINKPQEPKAVAAGPLVQKKVEVSPLPSSKPLPQKNADNKTNPLIKEQPKLVKFAYSSAALSKMESMQEGAGNDEKAVVAKVEPKPEAKVEHKTPDVKPEHKAESKPELVEEEDGLEWSFPANGKVIAGFSDVNKGIDISGKAGQAIFASAPGKVVYSGSGLRGYGKLIIIKHNKTYLSAYAHNDQLLVKEGQMVTRGQKIAEMGSSDAEQVKLHFEVRRLGKPVDPAKYLPPNKS